MKTARDPKFIAALKKAVSGDVKAKEPLSRWSTYRIGGPATVFWPAHEEDVADALKFCTDAGMPWFALGLGSNLLFPDEGLDALVIRIGKGLDGMKQEKGTWTLGAGLPAPLAAKKTAAAGWGGIHKMVGVPGSVGGGIVMNAGCHHAEWKDVVKSVLVVDAAGKDHVITAKKAGFSYRRSNLGHVVVLGTTIALKQEDPAKLNAETESLYKWRKEGTPFNQPCCGSVFKNPERPKIAGPRDPKTAGQYIEATGLKGLKVGAAEVSPMHCNYFVNTGDATADDVVLLMKEVRERVEEKWGVTLELECKVISPKGTIAKV